MNTNKIKVNFIIGRKLEIYMKGGSIPTGEGRIYDPAFWEEIESKVSSHKINLHNPFHLNFPLFLLINKIAYHFNNVRTVNREADPDAISHIFFEEESALLRLVKLKKTVVTCLDIIPISFPTSLTWPNDERSWFRKLRGRFLTWGYSRFYRTCIKGLKKADRILAESENTKRDLVKCLGIPAEKIKVAYFGINNVFKPVQVPEAFFQKYGLDQNKRYLLGVGGLHIPRKNSLLLIKLLPALLKQFPDLHLVITGYKFNSQVKGFYRLFNSLMKNPDVSRHVTLIENVPDEDLCHLYNLAEIFVYPSLYEGLGLPPIEAMACGTPVIVGNNSSLPEAVGNAGILVDSSSEGELTEAIARLLNDKNLQKELSEKGLRQAKSFSWKSYAQVLLETYHELNDSQ